MYRRIVKFIIDLIMYTVHHILFKIEFKNIEILDKYDKCIICANHSRIFDPTYLYPKVENMYTVAKAELYEKKFNLPLLEYTNAIPIKRNALDISGIKNIINTINEKDKIRLLIFPEGGVYKENYIENKRKTKSGAVYIAATAGVPIIPVYMTSRPKFFSKITVTFGEPFIVNPDVLNDKKLLRSEAKRLINYIYDFTFKKL